MRGGRPGRAGAALAVLLLGGCGQSASLPGTGMDVTITADEQVVRNMARLRVTFYGRAGEGGTWSEVRRAEVLAPDWPESDRLTAFLSPAGGAATRQWRVVAEACRGETGDCDRFVWAQRFGGYEAGRVRRVTIHLAWSCRARADSCDAEEQSCVVGEDGQAECRSARLEPEADGGAGDGGADSSAGDGGADGGGDAAADGCVEPRTWYTDCDGDGFVAADAASTTACARPEAPPEGCAAGAWVTISPGTEADCDDADPDVNPGASETCNGKDDDCDGGTDWEDPDTSGPWDPSLCPFEPNQPRKACFQGECRVGAGRLAAGEQFTCHLAVDGTVRCWGANDQGQLGDGDRMTDARGTAAPIDSTDTYRWIAGAYRTSCAVVQRGPGEPQAVHCWGDGSSGQLGGNDPPAPGSPLVEARPPTTSGWPLLHLVAVGQNHACAMSLEPGGLGACWGLDSSGQRADGAGATPGVEPPMPWRGLEGVMRLGWLATGYASTYVVANMEPDLSPGMPSEKWQVLGAGQNSSWQLGLGSGAPGSVPQFQQMTSCATGPLVSAVRVDGGYRHACVLFHDGRVRCTGNNDSGQLGDGSTDFAGGSDDRCFADRVAGGDFVAVSAGRTHSCAVKADGTVWCWGDNRNGQVMVGAGAAVTVPTLVGELPAPAVEVAAGASHTCARLRSGAVYCWGSGADGALGDGNVRAHTSDPVQVMGLPMPSL